MRSSSGRNSSGNNGGSRGGGGGRGNYRGAGNSRDDRQGQGGRPRNPRPEERRYDVGMPSDGPDGPRKGRGGAARGGAKGGPRQSPQRGGGRTAPARSREYDARTEQRNRERYENKPE